MSSSSSDSDFRKFVQNAFVVIAIGWVSWVTKTMLDLKSDMAIVKYHDFQTTAKAEPTKKEPMESGMNLFQFLFKEKKNDPSSTRCPLGSPVR